jgi:hypothetical protein
MGFDELLMRVQASFFHHDTQTKYDDKNEKNDRKLFSFFATFALMKYYYNHLDTHQLLSIKFLPLSYVFSFIGLFHQFIFCLCSKQINEG